MIEGRRRGAGRAGRGVLAVCGALLAVALVAPACVPEERGPRAEVDDGSDSARPDRAAPEFPAQGEVPAELLVEGLVYDLTERPRDQDYWSPSTPEAQCAAQGIVDGIGASRLSTLGYRVATPGASLNDIGLSDDERVVVVDRVMDCVDMVEGVASVLFGDGRIRADAATCVAEGLSDRDMLRPFVEAWAFGRALDPFASDAVFASTLLAAANVCIADADLNWFDLRLADDEPLIDSDLPGGASGSAYVDDRKGTTTSTAAPTPSTTAPTG
jgi:hypothetical protein